MDLKRETWGEEIWEKKAKTQKEIGVIQGSVGSKKVLKSQQRM